MAAIAMGKSRKADAPYLIVEDPRFGPGGWVTKVLKAYTADPDAPYARWFCVVTTQFTGSFGDMGDTYLTDVTGIVTYRDPEVPESALPEHLRGA